MSDEIVIQLAVTSGEAHADQAVDDRAPNKARKAIQIAVASGESGTPDILFALCDDGTMWRLPIKHDSWDWIQLPEIMTITPAAAPKDPPP